MRFHPSFREKFVRLNIRILDTNTFTLILENILKSSKESCLAISSSSTSSSVSVGENIFRGTYNPLVFFLYNKNYLWFCSLFVSRCSIIQECFSIVVFLFYQYNIATCDLYQLGNDISKKFYQCKLFVFHKMFVYKTYKNAH